MSRYVGEGGFCAPFFFFWRELRNFAGSWWKVGSLRIDKVFRGALVTMLNRGYELHLI